MVPRTAGRFGSTVSGAVTQLVECQLCKPKPDFARASDRDTYDSRTGTTSKNTSSDDAEVCESTRLNAWIDHCPVPLTPEQSQAVRLITRSR